MKKKISWQLLAVVIPAAILLVWLLLSSFGVINNFMGWDAQQAGIGWKVVELVLLAVFVYWIYWMCTGKVKVMGGSILFAVILFVLAVCSSTGFKFTGGDIGQRVSAFDQYGKIVKPEVLFEYYSEFYHLDTDTALVEYIRKYQELPGRNLNNALIRMGDHPRSTAPRADEDFKWHSHRDNSIYKNGE